MPTLQDYARLVLFYGSNALTQLSSVKLATNSGQQRVDLLNEGLAGFTPGSGDCQIDVGFFVPIGGPEHTAQQDCATGAYVTLQVGCGSLSYIGRGKIMSCEISQSTNGATEGTFSWTGELKTLE